MRPFPIKWNWLLWLAIPLATAASLGALLEHWRCSGRHEVLLLELINRLAQLESELRQLRIKLKKRTSGSGERRLRNGAVSVSIQDMSLLPCGSSSSDEFFDAESEAAAAICAGSGNHGNSSVVMLGLESDSAATTALELQELLNKADALLADGDENHRKAYDLMRDLLKRERVMANRSPVLLRWARACLSLHFAEAALGNSGAADDLLGQADVASAQALELDTGSADCHSVRARTLGLCIQNKGVKEKVRGAMKFRQLIDRGLELDPNHAELLELKGRFMYEMSQVGWLERKTATYLFGSDCLPAATLSDAQRIMDNAVAARPPGTIHALYWAARCRLEAGVDTAEAVRLLQLALDAKCNGVEDVKLLDEAAKLLQAYL